MNYRRSGRRAPVPLILAIATALALAACGGGGGGGGGGLALSAATPSSSTTANTNTTPATTPSATPASTSTTTTTSTTTSTSTTLPSEVVTTAQTSTYAAASEAATAFALLNSERQACGFGTLAQNSKLDSAATSFSTYLLANNYAGHYEDAGKPGYTGNSPLDRATSAGYNAAFIADLNTEITGVSDITGKGVFSIRSLLSAPYHLTDFIAPYREIGISILSSDTVGSTATYGKRSIEQYDLATATGATNQVPSGDAVLSYPCDGVLGTFFELVNESPSPVPGRDLMANPLGQPVALEVREGQTITIASAKMNVGDANGAAVALRTPMTSSNDPNNVLKANQALVIPDVALQKSTAYYVAITGTNDGVNFTKTFTFTTGTGTAR